METTTSNDNNCSEEDQLALYWAKQNDFTKALQLIENDYCLVNAQDQSGVSLLHISSLFGNLHFIKKLLSLGANVDIQDSTCHTPLHYAVMEGNAHCALALLDFGAKLESTNTEIMIVISKVFPVFVVGGKTPLHYAAERGHIECVKLLLSKGANPTAKDMDGYTPFHLACLSLHHDVAKLLNPSSSDLTILSNEERFCIFNEDFKRRSLRAAEQYRGITRGDCCVSCSHLEKQLNK
eukprot:TRINITY_DN7623_c0_g1_i2.p1 TRINITY_DN7623_c0_g1~~TRINITY_DN7623_c0_g1_i2.p1  ORF type:complete len:237 (+),score=44.02 TRINITY_DN7623_c0_g1_i2:43-753(+)